MSRPVRKIAAGLAAAAGLLLLAGCEPGPKDSVQLGYRGTGLNQIVDRNSVKPLPTIPAEAYPLPPDGGPSAGQSYQNLKVLGGISKDRFDHLMANISQWVAPQEQGCTYCHNPENMASDEKYTKVVARRMIQMTQTINSRWADHVKQTGVTCYTCHRGMPVPQYNWSMAAGAPNPYSIRNNRHGQNAPDPTVAYASLPSDPFSHYLLGAEPIRVASSDEHPSADHVVSIKDAEKTYGLMMHVSKALGVNCTYCHNSQSFRAWNLSRPQRVTAWYGIRMVRDVNQNYISGLASVFPANRKGPMGDPLKANCLTCHQGLNKPLGGISMIAQAPALKGPTLAPAAAPVPAATPTAAASAAAPPAKAPAAAKPAR